MGNSHKKNEYNFEHDFEILYQHDNYYELKRRNDSTLHIGRVIESADEDHIQLLQSVIEQKLENPSPFVNKLQGLRTFKQQSPCFKAWVHFYVLFPKHNHTLYDQIQSRSQRRQQFSQHEIEQTLLRICKGLKYIYSINDQHCAVSIKSVIWPIDGVLEEIKLADPWSIAYRTDYKQLYNAQIEETIQTKQNNYDQKWRLDLYQVGIVCLQMIYCGQRIVKQDRNNVQNAIRGINNSNIRNKIEMLCNQNPTLREHIFSLFPNKETRAIGISAPYDSVVKQGNNISRTHYPKAVETPKINYQQQFDRNLPEHSQRRVEHTPINAILSKLPTPPYRKINRTSTNTESHFPLSNNNIFDNRQNRTSAPYFQNNSHNTLNKFNMAPYNVQYNKPRLLESRFQSDSHTDNNNTNLFTPISFFSNLNRHEEHRPTLSGNYPQSKEQFNELKKQQNMNFIVNNSQQNIQRISATTEQVNKSEAKQSEIQQLIEESAKIKIQDEQYGEDNQVNKSVEISANPRKVNRYGPIVEIYSELYSSANSNQDGEDEDKEYIDEKYQNGSHYQGYKSKSTGLKNGKGIFYYSEGSYYDGEWKDNSMHGYGKLYYANHKPAYEGQWFFDQFHGKGRVYNDEPVPFNTPFNYSNFDNLEQQWDYYEGTLVSDSKEGQGKLMLSNGEYYEGQFQNDRIHGEGKFYTLSGEVIKAVWRDSVLVEHL